MNGQRPLVHVHDSTMADVKSYNQQTPAFLEHMFHSLVRLYVQCSGTNTYLIKTRSGLTNLETR